jgi:hypothetical protein
VVSAGFGTDFTVHDVPFHTSEKACVLDERPWGYLYDPTATHADDDVHDTPFKELDVASVVKS